MKVDIEQRIQASRDLVKFVERYGGRQLEPWQIDYLKILATKVNLDTQF